MHKSTLFKSFLLLLLMLGFSAAQAQVFTEDFGDQAMSEANWIGGGGNAGPEVWHWTNDPDEATFTMTPSPFASPTAENGYFIFNSDANGNGINHDVTLTGPSFDATSSTNTTVTFWSEYGYATAGAQAQLRVSIDGGMTWTSHTLFQGLQANTILNDQLSVDIPEADGQADVRLQFRWVGNYEYAWKIDDIEVSAAAQEFAMVTFQVNASQITVDAGGLRIATSVDGFATDNLLTNQGNGIWSVTLELPIGETVQYKFKNGPNGWESGQAGCGVSDGFGGYNRSFTVLGDFVLSAVCFNSCAECVVACVDNPQAIICDDFETYTLGSVSPQATWWKPWDAPDANATLSADVSDVYASNGTKSMKVQFEQAGTVQGNDQLLLLGNKSTGRYNLKWKMYVPTGNAAYYNLQNSQTPTGTQASDSWTLDVFFYADGLDTITNPVTANRVAYPHDTWFQVEHVIDLDNNIARLYINGQLRRAWTYTKNLGSVDFYASDATYIFYVDEVEYVQLPAVVAMPDACETAVDLTSYFGQAAGVTQSTPSYDNTDATASAYDPAVTCWDEVTGGGEDFIDNSLWFTFVGDGFKYNIMTDSCSANFILGGDTQLAVFSGTDCLNLSLEACNDDVNVGAGDYRSAVDIQTEPGQIYYVLVDGYNFGGQVSTGEFCFKITRVADLDCADIAVGTVDVANNGYVCNGQNVNEIVTVGSGFVLPTNGTIHGLAYAITTAPVPAGVWPVDLGNNLVATTQFLTSPFVVNLVNDGANFPAGTYYLTPIVLGGGTVLDPTMTPFLTNVDPSAGCFVVGESQVITLVDITDPLAVEGTVTNSTAPGNNGSIDLTVTGGYAMVIDDPSLYTYTWSNGATTQDVSGLAPGSYTVTVTDVTGCDVAFVATYQVTGVTGVNDPAALRTLTISPNPTPNTAILAMTLAQAADVRIEVINMLGQVLQTVDAGHAAKLTQSVDLSTLTNGTYMFRIRIDGEVALRRVVVQR